ncbi:Transcriptional regulator, AbrB family, partial [Dysosmobacter welbionis]
SLMACFWAVMTAAPWSTIRLNSAPVICSFICLVPPSQGHGIHAHVHVLDGDAGVPGDDIAHFIHDGAADCGEIDAVFHDDVELDG